MLLNFMQRAGLKSTQVHWIISPVRVIQMIPICVPVHFVTFRHSALIVDSPIASP